MDKITNNIINSITTNDAKNSKNSISEVTKEAVNVKAEAQPELVDIKDSKKLVSDLASSAPVDSDKVAKIKAAISSGNYPLDLDKVSDALMQAYREMKS
jgi:negative regulator of flagellin synthesis FlgM|tara:strand:+ start:846 stop:1142 length:297 start_codon:yes stop_codon:yes gene_type:complete